VVLKRTHGTRAGAAAVVRQTRPAPDLARRKFRSPEVVVDVNRLSSPATKMPLRLAILALPALALVPSIVPLRAPRAAQSFSVVERGTSSLEDTEGLGLCEKSTSASGAPDNSSLSHFSAMTPPCWLRRAARNRHRHAIEQASRR